MATKAIARKALALSEKERASLANLLLQSLDPPGEKLSRAEWTRVWKAELERRLEEVRSGKVAAIPADRVLAELRAFSEIV